MPEESGETELFLEIEEPGLGRLSVLPMTFILERPGLAVSLSRVSERSHPQIQEEGIFRGILGQAIGPAISLRPLRLPLFPQGRETEIAYRLAYQREPVLGTLEPA